MFESVNRENFIEKVLNAKKPVLLSYLHKNHDYEEHLANLSALGEKYQEKIEIFILENDSTFVSSYFCILGDPTFLAFNKGKETGRLLGRVLLEELAALCDRMLSRDI